MVGYDKNSSSYRIYIPEQRRILRSGHVIFNEHTTYFLNKSSNTLFPEDGSLRLIRENAVIGEKDPGLGNYLDGISPATAIKVKYQDKSKTIAEWQKEGIWDGVERFCSYLTADAAG